MGFILRWTLRAKPYLLFMLPWQVVLWQDLCETAPTPSPHPALGSSSVLRAPQEGEHS